MVTLGHIFRRIGNAARFNGVVCLFGVFCLAWSLPAAALQWLVPRGLRSQVGQFGIMAGFRAYLWIMQASGLAKFDLSGIDALAAGGPVVIICNHRSLLDAVMIISRLPRVVCITKASLWDNYFLGGGIRMAGYIRNDAPLRLVRAAAAALRQGHQQLLIFPEGTRSAQAAPGPFKTGFALVARSARVPVQTILIETDSPYLQKGWTLFRQPPIPMTCRARLGKRFEVGGDTRAFVHEIEQYFATELSGAACNRPP
jgi:1-acyl-sn-glycerol-3-phosphate acyltransferase